MAKILVIPLCAGKEASDQAFRYSWSRSSSNFQIEGELYLFSNGPQISVTPCSNFLYPLNFSPIQYPSSVAMVRPKERKGYRSQRVLAQYQPLAGSHGTSRSVSTPVGSTSTVSDEEPKSNPEAEITSKVTETSGNESPTKIHPAEARTDGATTGPSYTNRNSE